MMLRFLAVGNLVFPFLQRETPQGIDALEETSDRKEWRSPWGFDVSGIESFLRANKFVRIRFEVLGSTCHGKDTHGPHGTGRLS